LEVPSFSDSLPVERSNRVSSPATVGKKKGALSAALGASFGLLRCYQSAPTFSQLLEKGLTRIVSRLRRVCQRDRGINESVSSPSDNCSGVTKISTGSGAPICSTSSISRYQPCTVVERVRLTDIIVHALNGRNPNLWKIVIFIDMSQVDIRELSPVCPRRQLAPCMEERTNQRCTPRLSTWAVARKSPVGENVTDVAIELVRKASTRRPVGISNVLMVESRDVAINHLESGENVYFVR
jgi:hypothetical protein